MKFLRDLPIRRKLIWVTVITCGSALALACAALFWFQSVNFRKSFVAELQSLGAVLAENSAAPLAFADKKSEVEVLSALKVRPHISAWVFEANGKLFVGFGPEKGASVPARSVAFRQVVFDQGYAVLNMPIIVQDTVAGRLMLRANYQEKYQELLSLYGAVLATVLAGSLLVILLVSSVMQPVITAPIATLANVARKVSEKEDYTTRAPEAGRDEVGLLTRTFNQMLDQIQSREQRLRKSQQRFEVAVQGSSDGIWDWDLATDAVYFSPRWKSMLGYSDHELSNSFESFRELLHPDDSDQVQNKIKSYLAGGEPTFEVEFRARHKDGYYLWLLSRGAALRDEQGRPVRFAGSQTDITERKFAEQEVRLGREKFESLVNSIHGIVWEADPNTFEMLFVSKQAEAMLGYPTSVWLKERTFRETHLHPDDRVVTIEACRRGVVEGKPFQLEFRMLAADGRMVWMRESISLSMDHGKPMRLRGVAIDITEQKKAAEQITRMQQELLQTSRLAGMAEVATGVLHNVGNVLNSVNVSATIVCERIRNSEVRMLGELYNLFQAHEQDLTTFLTSDPRGRAIPIYFQHLSQQLQREHEVTLRELELLAKNIEHIKEIVAMQQSYARVAGVIESLPASALVDDALQINAGGFQRHGVEVVRSFQEVPLVAVDRHKVLQILINLFRNAKYAVDEAGRSDKRLHIGISGNGKGTIHITVEDNGIGISKENLTRIFSHGFTTKKEGHGFGLHSGAIAAQQMGGKLYGASDGIGKGATFTLELPIAKETNA